MVVSGTPAVVPAMMSLGGCTASSTLAVYDGKYTYHNAVTVTAKPMQIDQVSRISHFRLRTIRKASLGVRPVVPIPAAPAPGGVRAGPDSRGGRCVVFVIVMAESSPQAARLAA